MTEFYFTYVLLSLKDQKRYVGFTSNLSSRIEAHNKGQVASTKHRRPMKLVYYEACLSRADATRREKYLKTYYGSMFLKKRLNSYFTELDPK